MSYLLSIILLSIEPKAILFISLVKLLCLSLLNICRVFNINLLIFMTITMIFLKTMSTVLFSRWFILFSGSVASKQFL